MTAIFGILIFFFFIPLCFSVGWFVLSKIYKFCEASDEDASGQLLSPEGLLQCYLFGLLLVLSLQLLLLSCGLSWNLVMAGLLFLCGGSLRYSWGAFEFGIRRAWQSAPTVNFGLWLLVVFFLGVTLVYKSRSISTSWVNNYGDLSWHLGMISSFAIGENFPPEYVIFPGVRLSYPFFINLWTASFWWFVPEWWFLSLLFFLQWILCWGIIYVVLRGNKNRLLPWTVLFGGGAGILLLRAHPLLKPFRDLGGQAHSIIEQGFPWAPFLSTIWVTQRPALLGSAVVLASLSVFHRFVLPARDEKSRRLALLLAGLPLSFSVLVHTHLFLVTACYMGLCLFAGALAEIPRLFRVGPVFVFTELRLLLVFCCSLLPSFLFLPIIWGKRGILDFIPGWMPWKWAMTPGTKIADVMNAGAMWLTNAGAWFLCVLLLFVLIPRRREVLCLAFLFLLGNVVRMSFWEWDQIKFFLAVYLAFISFWAYAGELFPELARTLRRIQLAGICLLIPGLSEFFDSFFLRQAVFPVYIDSDLRAARIIRQLTPPQAILLAAPEHNSPVTLSGRRIFSGYSGTLASHGLDYLPRDNYQRGLEAVLDCRKDHRPEVPDRYCPQYLLWTERERRFWPGKNPAVMPQLKKTPALELWEIVS